MGPLAAVGALGCSLVSLVVNPALGNGRRRQANSLMSEFSAKIKIVVFSRRVGENGLQCVCGLTTIFTGSKRA